MPSTPSISAATRLSLLERARQREEEAWYELVDLYSPLVVLWCRRCSMRPEATADILQEVFASVAKSLGSYQAPGTVGAFRGWLWTITRNKLRDAARRDARVESGVGGSTALERLAGILDPDSIPEHEPSDVHELKLLASRGLAQIRDSFEPRTWQIFWRSAVDGIATEVIAKEMNISAAAVRQVRSRVLRRLRQQLGDAN